MLGVCGRLVSVESKEPVTVVTGSCARSLLPALDASAGRLLEQYSHTPSIAFRHLPPNSARFSYATEGALFISAQLPTDAVSALRKVRVLI